MSNERVSTVLGMVTGITCNIVMQNMAIAVLTAFFTGGAAYLGQVFFKYLHKKMKK